MQRFALSVKDLVVSFRIVFVYCMSMFLRDKCGMQRTYDVVTGKERNDLLVLLLLPFPAQANLDKLASHH